MAHSHSHGPLSLPRKRLRRIRIFLAAIVLPLALATAVGMWMLWPSGEQSPVGSIPAYSPGTVPTKVEVTSLDPKDCPDPLKANVPQTPDAPPPPDAYQPRFPSAVCATVLDGEHSGENVSIQTPPEVYASVTVGTVMKVLQSAPFPDAPAIYFYWDIERSSPMLWLIALYLVLVVVVARWRGAAAIAGLAASILVLVYFIMPALMANQPALLTTLVGVSAMLFLSVYFAHGISIRTTTALLGTFGGIFLTVTLALWETKAIHLSGASSEDAQLIFGFLPDVNLSALLVCGIVIAGLGALNDVTITQASAVWELHAANPSMGRAKLFARSMRIGRDHIASTVYTLAFAYAGGALPALLLALMVNRPAWDIIVSGAIAEEIVRTLIASIGLIVSIPLTTFIGTVLVLLTSTEGEAAIGDSAPAHDIDDIGDDHLHEPRAPRALGGRHARLTPEPGDS